MIALDPITLVLLGVTAMLALIALHVPIGVAMAISGLFAFAGLVGMGPALAALTVESSSALTNSDLLTVPLFLLMGSLASRAGLSADLYRLANAWVGHWRGGLAIATVIGCAGFGAICGSSIATTATMTRIALPEMLSRGYSQGLSTGAIAAGGTLGILIPPSIIMVIYAVLTEQFLLDLFKAAVLPGLLAILLYCVAVKLYVTFRPEAGPAGPAMAYAERWAISVQSWRALMVLGLVAGGIYSGVFTATEAASVGVAISFVFFLISQHASLPNLFAAFRETAVSTGMILVMVIGANVFGYFVTVSNAPQELVTFIGGLHVAPIWIIASLLVMYVLIGAVFDEVAAMVLTLPFVLPMIKGFGYDPIWWGIMNVMIIEIGLICPPIGLNVFVLQGVARHVPLTTIYRGITPFLLMDFVRVALLLAFPVIALWLVR